MVIIIVIMHRPVHPPAHRPVRPPEPRPDRPPEHRPVRPPEHQLVHPPEHRLDRPPDPAHRHVSPRHHPPGSQAELLHQHANQVQTILLSNDPHQQGHPAREAAEATVEAGGIVAEEHPEAEEVTVEAELPGVAEVLAVAEAVAEGGNESQNTQEKLYKQKGCPNICCRQP